MWKEMPNYLQTELKPALPKQKKQNSTKIQSGFLERKLYKEKVYKRNSFMEIPVLSPHKRL